MKRRRGISGQHPNRDNKKRCVPCGQVFPADHFHHSAREGGRSLACRACSGDRARVTGDRLLLARFGHKRCARCKHIMPMTSFGPCRERIDGLNKYCRECHASKNAAWERSQGDDYQRRRWMREQSSRKARHRKYYRDNAERLKQMVRDNWTAIKSDPERHAEFLIGHRKRGVNRRGRVMAAHYEPVDPAAIFARDRGRCWMCGKATRMDVPAQHPERCHLDHVVSLSNGGAHAPWNIKVACAPCNSSKSNRDHGVQMHL